MIYRAASAIDRGSVRLFNWADHYRVVSTISNIVALALKALIGLAALLRIRPSCELIKYLKRKKAWDCIFLLDPFFGQPSVIRNRLNKIKENLKNDWREALTDVTKDNCLQIYKMLCRDNHDLSKDVDFCAALVKLDFEMIYELSLIKEIRLIQATKVNDFTQDQKIKIQENKESLNQIMVKLIDIVEDRCFFFKFSEFSQQKGSLNELLRHESFLQALIKKYGDDEEFAKKMGTSDHAYFQVFSIRYLTYYLRDDLRNEGQEQGYGKLRGRVERLLLATLEMTQYQQARFLRSFLFCATQIHSQRPCYFIYYTLHKFEAIFSKEGPVRFSLEEWLKQEFSNCFKMDILKEERTIFGQSKKFYSSDTVDEQCNKQNLRYFLYEARQQYEESPNNPKCDNIGPSYLNFSYFRFQREKEKIEKQKIGIGFLPSKNEKFTNPELHVLPKNILKKILHYVDPGAFVSPEGIKSLEN